MRYFLIGIFLLSQVFVFATTSRGVAVSGGDSKTYINKWRKRNVENYCKAMAAKGVDCNTAFTDKEAKEKIKEAATGLKCGDNLFIHLMGHGGRGDDGLWFPRAKKKDFKKNKDYKDAQYLTAEEVLAAISELDCCVNVYVSVHSCFSGQFVDRLRKDRHIKCIVTSSARDEKAHKKPDGTDVNPRNWPDGFVDSLFSKTGGEGGGTFMELFQKAAANGKKKAEETGGNKGKGWADDDPQDFKRGHIQKVKKVDGGFIITLDLGGKTAVSVFMPSDASGNLKRKPKHLQVCMDISCSGSAVWEDGKFKPEEFKIEGFEAKFHILKVADKKTGKVLARVISPKGIFNEPKTLFLKPLPEDATFCKWYKGSASVAETGTKVDVSDPVPVPPDRYEVEAHVQEFDQAKGEGVVMLDAPDGKKVKVKLRPGNKINLKHCVMIKLEGQMKDGVIDDAVCGGIIAENWKGKVKKINPDGTVDVELEKPDRLKGETVKVKPKNGVPNGVGPGSGVAGHGVWDGDQLTDGGSMSPTN